MNPKTVDVDTDFIKIFWGLIVRSRLAEGSEVLRKKDAVMIQYPDEGLKSCEYYATIKVQ